MRSMRCALVMCVLLSGALLFPSYAAELLAPPGLYDVSMVNEVELGIMINGLGDEDPDARVAAAQWLTETARSFPRAFSALVAARMRFPGAVSALVAAQRDEDTEVARAARTSLRIADMSDPVVAANVIREASDEAPVLVETMIFSAGTYNRDVTDAVCSMLDDKSDSVRRCVVYYLGKADMDNPLVVDSLIYALLWDGDAEVRADAATGLGRADMRDQRVVDSLINALQNEEVCYVRVAVAAGLGRVDMRVYGIGDKLVKVMNDQHTDTKVQLQIIRCFFAENALCDEKHLTAAINKAFALLDPKGDGIDAQSALALLQDLNDREGPNDPKGLSSAQATALHEIEQEGDYDAAMASL